MVSLSPVIARILLAQKFATTYAAFSRRTLIATEEEVVATTSGFPDPVGYFTGGDFLFWEWTVLRIKLKIRETEVASSVLKYIPTVDKQSGRSVVLAE
jgi:hypothetical protein